MILVYTPDGQAEQRWEFKLGKLRTAECEAIEKRTGMPYSTEFQQKLLQGNISARRALLWTMLRRVHHTIPYGDVDFAADELLLEMDRDEYQNIYDELTKVAGISDEEREFQLAVIGAEIARLDEEKDSANSVDEPGKAPSSDSASVTG